METLNEVNPEMSYIFEVHKMLIAKNIILAYEGEFTQEITKSVLSMTERNLESMGEESGVKRKVFNIMVECLQNIVKHSEEVAGSPRSLSTSALFMIGQDADKYTIVSGNPIRADRTSLVSERIDYINTLDKDGLKQLYKDVIKNGEISDRGGAGLGFIDMARKSGQKLEYNFSKIDGELMFFSLMVTVSKLGGGE